MQVIVVFRHTDMRGVGLPKPRHAAEQAQSSEGLSAQKRFPEKSIVVVSGSRSRAVSAFIG
jgi:hypothetical protein